MGLNVFKDYKCWSNRYRLTHPWVVIVAGWRNLRAAWQRATRGYADRDVWNLDNYFLQLFPETLKQLSQTSHGYPYEWESYEKWAEFLYQLAIDFEKCQDDEGNDENEYYEDYMKSLDDSWVKRHENGIMTLESKPEHEEIAKYYFARMKELSKERQKLLEECCTKLGQHLRELWD